MLRSTHKQQKSIHAVSLQGGQGIVWGPSWLQTCFHHPGARVWETANSTPGSHHCIYTIHICTRQLTSISTFIPLPRCLSLSAKTIWKKIPQLPLHFSFKEVQVYLQHLTHPSHGAVLAWGGLWAPWGKSYTHTLGDHPVHTGALKVADGVVSTTTSSWLCQPNLQLDMHNALQHHLANFSQRFQLILLSWGAPHTAARCYRRRQVRWRQQRAGSVKPACEVSQCSAKRSFLHLGCKLSYFQDFSKSPCFTQLPGTSWPFFTEVHALTGQDLFLHDQGYSSTSCSLFIYFVR